MAPGTRKAGQIGGSPAPLPAHHVRSGNDPPDRILPWNRELFTAFFRPPTRRSATDTARLPAARPFDLYRRKPSNHPAVAGDVSRRPVAQRDFGELRVPPSECARQPAAHVRRVREPREPGALRFGYARTL